MTMSKREELEREYFMKLIGEMEESSGETTEDLIGEMEESDKTTKKKPLPHVVKYHDLLEKLWGWDRLLQLGSTVTLPVYTKYLEEYHRRKVHAATTDTSLSAPAGTLCLTNEEQLVSEFMARVEPEQKPSLLMWRPIILSFLIQKRQRSVNHPAGCKLSDLSGAALLCVAREADLTCELLRLEAPIDDDLIILSTTIRLCALSLMSCTQDNSVSASAAMLGMAKEAEMMCLWMQKNKAPIDLLVDPMPIEMWDCNDIRRCTLHFIVDNILKNSLAAECKIVEEEPAAEHMTVDGAANTIGDSQYEKGGEKGNKGKRQEEHFSGKIWIWESLVKPLVKSFESKAPEFVASAAAFKIPEDAIQTGHAIAKFCLEMEEEFLSVWNTRVEPRFGWFGDPLAVNSIMESSLIKEHALLICGTVAELDIPSAVAFLCIAKEAELMCELLKHGAKPSSQFIQLSSGIRLCALGLLKGHPSFASAAAMMGMANEAQEMCNWMKRENRLVTLSLSESRGLEVPHLIRTNAFNVMMTSILVDSSFSSSKTPDDAVP